MGTKKAGKKPIAPRKKAAPDAPVRAYVMLRPAEGTGDAELSPFIAAPAKPSSIAEATKRLGEHGFRVTGSSAAAITIEAGRGVFEQVFGSPVRTAKQARAKRAAHRAPASLARAKAPFTIPDNLKELVQEVVFPAAIETH